MEAVAESPLLFGSRFHDWKTIILNIPDWSDETAKICIGTWTNDTV